MVRPDAAGAGIRPRTSGVIASVSPGLGAVPARPADGAAGEI